MTKRDPLSVIESKIPKNRFAEAKVVKIYNRTRTAAANILGSNSTINIDISNIDPNLIREDRSRLLVYVPEIGTPIAISIIPYKKAVYSSEPAVTLGDIRGGSRLNIRNSSGEEKFSVNSLGVVAVSDGVTAPSARDNLAQLYVDTADSHLKVKHSTGTTSDLESGTGHSPVTLASDADVLLGLNDQQLTFDSQSANTILAAPDGSSGDPTFRTLVISDLPTLQLGANVAASATTCTLVGLQDGPIVKGGWFAFDPWTVECEIRKWTGGTATSPTFAALDYAHSQGDPVLWLNEPIANVKWFGALGDGSTDDTAEIQAAIDTLDTDDGGTVYLPQGTYIFSDCIEILNRHNVQFIGDGIDITILDCSATANLDRVNYSATPVGEGCITITSDDNMSPADTPIENITIADLTLKCSTSGSVSAYQKAIWVGATQHCTLERVKVDGNGPNSEAIYHQDSFGKLSADWIVQDCEVNNPGLVGINSNDTQIEGYRFVRNHIHDGSGSGITAFANRGGNYSLIADNVIADVDGAAGIAVMDEGDGTVTYIANVIIRNNHLLRLGSGDVAVSRYGIRVNAINNGSAIDASILVQGNIITDIEQYTAYSCTGISVYGPVTVKDNILRNCVSSSNSTAIAVAVPDHSGTGTPIIDGNRIERCDSGAKWTRGISLSNNAATDGTVVINNYVDADAIDSGGYALVDYRHALIHRGNILNAQFILNNYTCNYYGELTDATLSPENLYAWRLGYQDATPSVHGIGVGKTYGAPYTLTDLDDGVAGQTFTLIFDGPLTVDFTGTNLKGNNGVNYAGSTNDAMICVYDGTYWHCTIMPTIWPPTRTVSESESISLSDTPAGSVV